MRTISILLFLTIAACSSSVPVVAKGKISTPTGRRYCIDLEVGSNRTPVVSCTPNKRLCEWGYERARKFGALADVKSVTACYQEGS